jgi:hypothetical protein
MASRIRIRLKAFDHWVVDQTASDIVRTAEKTGATVKGPIPLPTRRERWTVLRGPHIDDLRFEAEQGTTDHPKGEPMHPVRHVDGCTRVRLVPPFLCDGLRFVLQNRT